MQLLPLYYDYLLDELQNMLLLFLKLTVPALGYSSIANVKVLCRIFKVLKRFGRMGCCFPDLVKIKNFDTLSIKSGKNVGILGGQHSFI